MKCLLERVSSSSLCVGWAVLFFVALPGPSILLFFIVKPSKKYPESSLDQQVAQASGT